MLTALLGLAVALHATPDTTLPVSRGQRLDVDLHAGSVTVRTWGRDAVRIEGDFAGNDALELQSDASRLGVTLSRRSGGPGAADLVITAPAWMTQELSGLYLDVTVEPCKCAVSVETVQGDVTVRGAEGVVTLQVVHGSVLVENIRGKLAANAVNDDVTVRNVSGDVRVEAVNGDVTLQQVRSDNVAVSTVNGDIRFEGDVRPKGRYALASHQGEVVMVLPPDAGATVRVDTFNGEFSSDYPVTLQGDGARRKRTFTLGSGSASVDLESFSGDVRLVKPGSRPGR